MRYILLIYSKEDERRAMPPEERRKAVEQHVAIIDEAVNRGMLVGVNPLADSACAKTVRVENGKVLATDGPFAETREQLAGYYVLDCQNVDEAIAWAARIPHCKGSGCVEVRPINELPVVPDSFRSSTAALGSLIKG